MLQFGSQAPVEIKPVDVKHIKALPFIRYDSYVDSYNAQTLEDDSIPLADYLNKKDRLSAVPIVSGSSGIHQTLLHLPGESAPCTRRVATEDGKVFCRSLLEALWEVEQLSECFEDFSMANIYIRNGRVVLHRVIRKGLQPAQLIRNYKSVKNIIEAAFLVFGSIPDDIQHLLNLIENEHDKRSLFRIHASLWLLSDRGGMYFRMHEKLKQLSQTDKDSILEVMGKLKYISTWRSDVQSNDLLLEIYTYKTWLYAVPTNVVDPLAVQVKEGGIFTSYLRNRVAHRMDKYHQHLPYSAQGSELGALIRWPTALVTLQYELHKVKKPGDLNNGELY